MTTCAAVSSSLDAAANARDREAQSMVGGVPQVLQAAADLRDQFLRWWSAAYDVISELPMDARTLAIAGAITAASLLVVAWMRASRRARRFRVELDRAREELAEVTAKYESELKWRTAAEKVAPRPTVNATTG